MTERVPNLSYSLSLSFNDNCPSSEKSSFQYVKIDKNNTIHSNSACPLTIVGTAVPQALHQVLTHYGVETNTMDDANLTQKIQERSSANLSFSSFKRIHKEPNLNSTKISKFDRRKKKLRYQKTKLGKGRDNPKSNGTKRKCHDVDMELEEQKPPEVCSFSGILNHENDCSKIPLTSKKINIYENILLNVDKNSCMDAPKINDSVDDRTIEVNPKTERTSNELHSMTEKCKSVLNTSPTYSPKEIPKIYDNSVITDTGNFYAESVDEHEKHSVIACSSILHLGEKDEISSTCILMEEGNIISPVRNKKVKMEKKLEKNIDEIIQGAHHENLHLNDDIEMPEKTEIEGTKRKSEPKENEDIKEKESNTPNVHCEVSDEIHLEVEHEVKPEGKKFKKAKMQCKKDIDSETLEKLEDDKHTGVRVEKLEAVPNYNEKENKLKKNIKDNVDAAHEELDERTFIEHREQEVTACASGELHPSNLKMKPNLIENSIETEEKLTGKSESSINGKKVFDVSNMQCDVDNKIFHKVDHTAMKGNKSNRAETRERKSSVEKEVKIKKNLEAHENLVHDNSDVDISITNETEIGSRFRKKKDKNRNKNIGHTVDEASEYLNQNALIKNEERHVISCTNRKLQLLEETENVISPSKKNGIKLQENTKINVQDVPEQTAHCEKSQQDEKMQVIEIVGKNKSEKMKRKSNEKPEECITEKKGCDSSDVHCEDNNTSLPKIKCKKQKREKSSGEVEKNDMENVNDENKEKLETKMHMGEHVKNDDNVSHMEKVSRHINEKEKKSNKTEIDIVEEPNSSQSTFIEIKKSVTSTANTKFQHSKEIDEHQGKENILLPVDESSIKLQENSKENMHDDVPKQTACCRKLQPDDSKDMVDLVDTESDKTKRKSREKRKDGISSDGTSDVHCAVDNKIYTNVEHKKHKEKKLEKVNEEKQCEEKKKIEKNNKLKKNERNSVDEANVKSNQTTLIEDKKSVTSSANIKLQHSKETDAHQEKESVLNSHEKSQEKMHEDGPEQTAHWGKLQPDHLKEMLDLADIKRRETRRKSKEKKKENMSSDDASKLHCVDDNEMNINVEHTKYEEKKSKKTNSDKEYKEKEKNNLCVQRTVKEGNAHVDVQIENKTEIVSGYSNEKENKSKKNKRNSVDDANKNSSLSTLSEHKKQSITASGKSQNSDEINTFSEKEKVHENAKKSMCEDEEQTENCGKSRSDDLKEILDPIADTKSDKTKKKSRVKRGESFPPDDGFNVHCEVDNKSNLKVHHKKTKGKQSKKSNDEKECDEEKKIKVDALEKVKESDAHEVVQVDSGIEAISKDINEKEELLRKNKREEKTFYLDISNLSAAIEYKRESVEACASKNPQHLKETATIKEKNNLNSPKDRMNTSLNRASEIELQEKVQEIIDPEEKDDEKSEELLRGEILKKAVSNMKLTTNNPIKPSSTAVDKSDDEKRKSRKKVKCIKNNNPKQELRNKNIESHVQDEKNDEITSFQEKNILEGQGKDQIPKGTNSIHMTRSKRNLENEDFGLQTEIERSGKQEVISKKKKKKGHDITSKNVDEGKNEIKLEEKSKDALIQNILIQKFNTIHSPRNKKIAVEDKRKIEVATTSSDEIDEVQRPIKKRKKHKKLYDTDNEQIIDVIDDTRSSILKEDTARIMKEFEDHFSVIPNLSEKGNVQEVTRKSKVGGSSEKENLEENGKKEKTVCPKETVHVKKNKSTAVLDDRISNMLKSKFKHFFNVSESKKKEKQNEICAQSEDNKTNNVKIADDTEQKQNSNFDKGSKQFPKNIERTITSHIEEDPDEEHIGDEELLEEDLEKEYREMQSYMMSQENANKLEKSDCFDNKHSSSDNELCVDKSVLSDNDMDTESSEEPNNATDSYIIFNKKNKPSLESTQLSNSKKPQKRSINKSSNRSKKSSTVKGNGVDREKDKTKKSHDRVKIEKRTTLLVSKIDDGSEQSFKLSPNKKEKLECNRQNTSDKLDCSKNLSLDENNISTIPKESNNKQVNTDLIPSNEVVSENGGSESQKLSSAVNNCDDKEMNETPANDIDMTESDHVMDFEDGNNDAQSSANEFLQQSQLLLDIESQVDDIAQSLKENSAMREYLQDNSSENSPKKVKKRRRIHAENHSPSKISTEKQTKRIRLSSSKDDKVKKKTEPKTRRSKGENKKVPRKKISTSGRKTLLDFFKKDDAAVHRSETSTSDKDEASHPINTKQSREIADVDNQNNKSLINEVGVSDDSEPDLISNEAEDEKEYSFADILSQSHSSRLNKEWEQILDQNSEHGAVSHSEKDSEENSEESDYCSTSYDTPTTQERMKRRKFYFRRRPNLKKKDLKKKVIKIIRESGNVWEILEELEMDMNDEMKKKIKNLVIKRPYPLSRIHTIAPFLIRGPTEEQKKELQDLGIKLKYGPFSPKEDDIIKTNWKNFCELYDWDETDYLPFVNGSKRSKHGILGENQMECFVQFISQGIENRTMDKIFQRFCRICQSRERNQKFTKDEDEIIMEFMKKNQSTRPFADIARILDTTRADVIKRYNYLKTKKSCPPRIIWNKAMAEKLLVILTEVTCTINLSELKNRKINHTEWLKVAERMKIPVGTIKKSWYLNLYPRFFTTNYSENLRENKKKLIDIVLSRYSKWHEVEWESVAKEMGEGFLAMKCCKTLKDLVKNLDKDIQDDLKESLKLLKTKTFTLKKTNFDFVEEILKETENGTILPKIDEDAQSESEEEGEE